MGALRLRLRLQAALLLRQTVELLPVPRTRSAAAEPLPPRRATPCCTDEEEGRAEHRDAAEEKW